MPLVDATRLAQHLQNNTGLTCFVVAGDEILLQVEAADAIRQYAREHGYSERHRYELDGRSSWDEVFAVTQEVSLFGDKHLIEVHLPSGKPGRHGSDAIATLCQQFAQQQLPDTMLLLLLPRLDRATRNAKWAQTLSQQAVWVDVPQVDRRALPNWIRERLQRQQQQCSHETIEWLAEKVEGNLLAAHQEITKLALLHDEGQLQLEDVQNAVLNVARYNVFDLRDAMLAGNAQRALTILNGLRGEGEELPLILWAVGDEVRVLARLAQNQQNLQSLFRSYRIFGPREQLVRQSLQRVPATQWITAVKHAHDIDRLIKGLKPEGRLHDPWEETARLIMRVATATR